MPHEPVNEKVSSIIVKILNGQLLDRMEKRALKRWMKSSRYYRSLLDDVYTDLELRDKLLQSYRTNKNEFWKIVLTYRAALHDGMPPRTGNFWERLFLFWK